ncbi:MAG: Gfo/Idh/MocA family oxidoreductase [Chloroflexi bacterium]|nr:Gfo/Idh/MocA family oxidoreductase [Chloroflexota bacterium]
MAGQLNVALVGAAGKVGAPAHLNALDGIPRANLYALCDANTERLREVGRERGVPVLHKSLEETLANPNVDAVSLATPPFVHAGQAVAAAKAGKHVYCEKPMAPSLGDCRRMVETAKNAGVTLMVGESYVFTGSHVLARRLIDEGEIGDVVQVRQAKGVWVFRPEEDRRLGGKGHDDIAWRYDPELSGGGEYPWMMDHGPHFFALARYLAQGCGIARVCALPRSQSHGAGRHRRGITAVTWAYQGGAADGMWTQVETPAEATDVIGFRTEVYGTKGMIRVFGEGGGAAPGFPQPPPVTLARDGVSRSFDPKDGVDRSWVSNVAYYDRAHRNALEHFVDSVLDGTPPRYDGTDGAADMAATLATIMSATEGRAVPPGDVPDDWTAFGGT